MRFLELGPLLIAQACLSGCGGAPAPGPGIHHGGRYLGIGVYPAGSMWSRIALADRAGDGAAARTGDDEQVIVLVDSRTGEVRQCGNLTGYCIGMNPWAGPLGRGRAVPVGLTEHAEDRERAAGNEPAAAAPANGAE
jgi:hypothetical protein